MYIQFIVTLFSSPLLQWFVCNEPFFCKKNAFFTTLNGSGISVDVASIYILIFTKIIESLSIKVLSFAVQSSFDSVSPLALSVHLPKIDGDFPSVLNVSYTGFTSLRYTLVLDALRNNSFVDSIITMALK